MCLSPIWTAKHETARRLAQRIKIVLDMAKSKGFRSGENPALTAGEGVGTVKPTGYIRKAINIDQLVKIMLRAGRDS